MGTAKATRAADKSQVCRRLVQALQKLYGKSVPQIQLPVLETMLLQCVWRTVAGTRRRPG